MDAKKPADLTESEWSNDEIKKLQESLNMRKLKLMQNNSMSESVRQRNKESVINNQFMPFTPKKKPEHKEKQDTSQPII